MKTLFRLKILLIIGLFIWPSMTFARVISDADPVDQAYSGRSYRSVPVDKALPVAKPQSTVGKLKSFWSSVKKKVKTKVDAWRAEAPTPAASVANGPEKAAEPVIPQKSQAEILAEEVLTVDKTPTQDTKSKLSDVKSNLSDVNPIATISPGRAASPDIPVSKAGVPTFALKKKVKDKKGKISNIKVKNIPRLDVGEEPKISSKELTDIGVVALKANYKSPKPLKSDKVFQSKSLSKWLKTKIAKAKDPSKLKDSKFGLGKVVSHRKIDNISLLMNSTFDGELKPTIAFTKDDINMLGSLILFDKGDRCHVVIGLFADLAKKSKYKNEAEFYLGACSYKMGFYSEAANQLLKVVKREDSEFAGPAIGMLLRNMPREYDEKIAEAVRQLKNKSLVRAEDQNEANYVMARVSYKKNNYKRALDFAALVNKDSKYYPQSQYIKGISEYSIGQGRTAESTLEGIRKFMVNNGLKDTNLLSLTSISLGRIRFNQNRFKEALADYTSIKKDHPLWIEGLVEQGWTQLQLGDYAGAIGNMYSLHSPYFKSVFMPESHVIRTIGYLNICQYGDAYRTLTRLEDEHTKWYKNIDAYIRANPSSSKYYDLVKTYLRGNSQTNVAGLPHQVIREVSRQKDFLNYQSSINDKEDELTQYDFIDGIIRKDKSRIKARLIKSVNRAKNLRSQIKQAKTKKALMKNVNEWKGFLRNEIKLARAIKFELALYERGRRGYAGLKKTTINRFAKEKTQLRQLASKSLAGHLKRIRTNLKEILSSNEFLRYEIFAGSGENIRYQVAGGKAQGANRIPASIKPQKALKWSFSGEYWADEIGAYRSALKNNCPEVNGGGGTGYKASSN